MFCAQLILHLFLISYISSDPPAQGSSEEAFLSSVSSSALVFLIPFAKGWIKQWLQALVLTYCPITNGQYRMFWWIFLSWQCRKNFGLPPPLLEQWLGCLSYHCEPSCIYILFQSICHFTAWSSKCCRVQAPFFYLSKNQEIEKKIALKNEHLIWKRWPRPMKTSTFLE